MTCRCRPIIAAVLGLYLLAGCASVQKFNRMDTFDKASQAYAKTITWSNFDGAASFLPPRQSADSAADPQALKQIRVTSYRVKQFQSVPDASEVRQQVEIGYYRVDDMRLKTIRDEQRWVYDTDAGRWFVQSGLPDFELH